MHIPIQTNKKQQVKQKKLFPQIIRHQQDDEHIQQNYSSQKMIPGITAQQVLEQIKKYPILYECFLKNNLSTQSRTLQAFMKLPSKNDCPGFIYGFMNQRENGPYDHKYWIKMGRTKHDAPQKRIFQWQKDDDHQYTQIFTIRSQKNMKLQALVHFIFTYARKTRVINNKNRTQWFQFNSRVLNAAIVNMINQIMYKLQQPALKGLEYQIIDNIEPNEKNHPNIINLNKNNDQNSIRPQKNQKSIKWNLQKIIKQIQQKQSNPKQKKLILLIGLNKRLMDLTKQLLDGQSLKIIKKKIKNIYQKIPKSILNQNQYCIKIQLLYLLKKQQEIENSFIAMYQEWIKLYSAKQIKILIVINQSDITSSAMYSLFVILKELIKYNCLSQEIKICIVNDPLERDGIQLNKDTIIQYLKEDGALFHKDELSILLNAGYIHLKNYIKFDVHQDQDSNPIICLDSEFRQKTIYEWFTETKSQLLDALQLNSYIKKSSLQLKYPQIMFACQQIVHAMKQQVSLIYQAYFQQFVKNIQQNVQTKAQKIFYIYTIIKLIRQKSYQHEIYHLHILLLKSLKMNFQNNPQQSRLKLYIFSQCILLDGTNQIRDINLQNVFTRLLNRIKYYQNIILQKQNQKIKLYCQQFNIGLNYYIKQLKNINQIQCHNIIDLLNNVKNLQNNNQFIEIIKYSSIINYKQVFNIINIMEQVTILELCGIRCMRVLNEIKRQVCILLKNYQSINKVVDSPKKQQKLRTLDRFIKNLKDKQLNKKKIYNNQVLKKYQQGIKQQYQSIKQNQIEQIEQIKQKQYYRQQQQVIQIKQLQIQLKQKQKKIKKTKKVKKVKNQQLQYLLKSNNMIQLLCQIQKINKNRNKMIDFIINVSPIQFIINCTQKSFGNILKIKEILLILSKRIKINNELQNLQNNYQKIQKVKKKIIIMVAEDYQNLQKLTNLKSHTYTIVPAYIIDNNLIPLNQLSQDESKKIQQLGKDKLIDFYKHYIL